MNKKFFVSIVVTMLTVNLFCDSFSDEIWRKGDDAYLRSIVNMIDSELFGSKLSEHVKAVNWGTKAEGHAATTCYNDGTWNGTAFCWIGINNRIVDSNNIDFETIYCVLLHEMCHVATYMIDGVMHEDSSIEFKRWIDYAQKESKIAKNYDISWFNANAYRGAVK